MDKASEAIKADLLPTKSSKRYKQAGDEFSAWMLEKKQEEITENAVLVYLNEKAEKYCPSTLLSTFSMIKSTHRGVNMDNFHQVKAFLDRK